MYFVLLTFEKLTGFAKHNGGKVRLVLRYVYTMAFVCLGWLVFRAENMTAAWDYLRNMLGVGTAALDDTFWYYIDNYLVYLIAAAVFALPVAPRLRKAVDALHGVKKTVCDVLYTVGIFALFLVAIACIVKGSYNPFIYFNF